MICNDPISGSYSITQTNKFLLMDAKALTLGQGHGRVIHYISPDPYILCAKYQRFSQMIVTWEGKIFAAADADT